MAEKTKVAPWITPGAEFKTRSGQLARIYAVDGAGSFPVHGALRQVSGGWGVRAWTSAGTVFSSGLENGGDLKKPTPAPEGTLAWGDSLVLTGAELKTRDGTEARIYAVDGGGEFPVHGAVLHEGQWFIHTWRGTGTSDITAAPSAFDLMKPARRRVAYVSLDAGGGLHLSSDPTETHGSLIAGSVRVEVVEGEFAAVDGEEPA